MKHASAARVVPIRPPSGSAPELARLCRELERATRLTAEACEGWAQANRDARDAHALVDELVRWAQWIVAGGVPRPIREKRAKGTERARAAMRAQLDERDRRSARRMLAMGRARKEIAAELRCGLKRVARLLR